MSRFDPEKVEWPDRHIGPIEIDLFPPYPRSFPVLPATAYDELHEAAKQMAEAIEAWRTDPMDFRVDDQMDAALANFQTPSVDIPDEAVEALLREQAAQMGEGWGEGADAETMEDARAQLAAAAPIIRQQALAEARARVEGLKHPAACGKQQHTHNRAIDDALAAIDGGGSDE